LQEAASDPTDESTSARSASPRGVQFLPSRAVTTHLGCVACAAADAETRRWFFFLETETNHDEGVRSRIRAAGGLCPPHTRRLLASTAAPWLARGVFDDLIADLLRGRQPGRWSMDPGHRLHRLAPRRRHRRAPLQAPCPVCWSVADRVRDTLRVLDEAVRPGAAAAEVAAAYRAGPGLCVTHARQLIVTASPGATRLVAGRLAAALAVPPEEAVAVLTGGDDDAPARAAVRDRHGPVVLEAAAAARRASFAARVAHLTDQPCCPLCAARDRATWRLLDWLAGRAGGGGDQERPDARGMREQLAGICAVHLSDLVVADGGGAWLSGPVATVVRLAAARWRETGLDLESAARSSVAATASRDRIPAAARLRALAASFGPRMSCLVCSYSAQAVDRELQLLQLVAADTRLAEAVRDAHGLCARCVAGLGADSPWARFFAERARQLGFELTDAARADSWTARWDVRGSERSSWQRAPFLLDGAVLGPRPPHAQ